MWMRMLKFPLRSTGPREIMTSSPRTLTRRTTFGPGFHVDMNDEFFPLRSTGPRETSKDDDPLAAHINICLFYGSLTLGGAVQLQGLNQEISQSIHMRIRSKNSRASKFYEEHEVTWAFQKLVGNKIYGKILPRDASPSSPGTRKKSCYLTAFHHRCPQIARASRNITSSPTTVQYTRASPYRCQRYAFTAMFIRRQ
jgi:hypothetical protein